jgi:hypothetical protein
MQPSDLTKLLDTQADILSQPKAVFERRTVGTVFEQTTVGNFSGVELNEDATVELCSPIDE